MLDQMSRRSELQSKSVYSVQCSPAKKERPNILTMDTFSVGVTGQPPKLPADIAE